VYRPDRAVVANCIFALVVYVRVGCVEGIMWQVGISNKFGELPGSIGIYITT